MKSIVITRPGGAEVLATEERPVPEPGPGEIRVRVQASALNRADVLQRMGSYPAPPGAPADVPGLEYAGEVDAVGEGAGLWAVGNRTLFRGEHLRPARTGDDDGFHRSRSDRKGKC